MGKKNKPALSLFFQFNNKETIQELERVISLYEGVLPENIQEYVSNAHSLTKGKLFTEAKTMIKTFWRQNPQLTLSDVKGLIELSMVDIQAGFFKKTDDIMGGGK